MLSLGLLRTKFQASLRSKDLERFDPTKMGKEPPIPIIPERVKPSEEEEAKEKCKLKIKVSEGVTKTFIEFAGGTPEDLIEAPRGAPGGYGPQGPVQGTCLPAHC